MGDFPPMKQIFFLIWKLSESQIFYLNFFGCPLQRLESQKENLRHCLRRFSNHKTDSETLEGNHRQYEKTFCYIQIFVGFPHRRQLYSKLTHTHIKRWMLGPPGEKLFRHILPYQVSFVSHRNESATHLKVLDNFRSLQLLSWFPNWTSTFTKIQLPWTVI